MGERHFQMLKLLFEDFGEEEIEQLFRLCAKLYEGMERVGKFEEELGR